jgi:predicted nucleic acid-binding protein
MSARSVEPPPKIVLDAGPLIALLHRTDADHAVAVAGFRQLADARVRLIVPLAILFEVYKWLLYEGGAAAARFALVRMRQSADIVYPGAAELDAVAEILATMPAWAGTLEDATVAVIGLRLASPAWTLNYRDLSAFRQLQFWTPAVD